MNIEKIAELTRSTILYKPEGKEIDIHHAGASDLMSDVLAYLSEMPPSVDLLLITGLVNPQTIRTANILDIPVVMFTRGKIVHQAILDSAIASDLAVLTTPMTSFTACGILFGSGIEGIDRDTEESRSSSDDAGDN